MEGRAGSPDFGNGEEERVALSLQDRESQVNEAKVLRSLRHFCEKICLLVLNSRFLLGFLMQQDLLVFSQWRLKWNAAALIYFNWQLGKSLKYFMTFYCISQIVGCFFQKFTWNDISEVYVTVS